MQQVKQAHGNQVIHIAERGGEPGLGAEPEEDTRLLQGEASPSGMILLLLVMLEIIATR